MGVGHVALALGASKAAERINVGWLVFAALLSDFLLGIFATAGLEHSSLPENYARQHYLLFTFPYSHGLVPLLLWAAIFGFIVSRLYQFDRRRILLVVAMVVLSHYLLDGLVHIAGLPVAGEASPKLGLGLWRNMPMELSTETVMAIVAIAIYWNLDRSAPRWTRYAMAIFVLLVTSMTWTQLAATEPPPAGVLKITWIVAPLLFAGIAYAIDRKRVPVA